MATNVKTRIELTDTRESMILKMSDGIPGAMTVLSAMVPMSNGNGTKQKCPVCKRRIRGSNHENGHHHQEALAKQRK